METTEATNEAPGTQTKRYYTITDNGDWMELGAIDPRSGGYASVYFISVETEDEDDFLRQAEDGAGTVLAQVWVEGSQLTYYVPDAQ